MRIYNHIRTQIDELEPITCPLSDGTSITVTCSMYCTLIYGKVMSVLTGSAGVVNCSICFAKPSQMNKIENFGKDVLEPKLGTLQFGLSPLQMWIRFFECLLHISYRYDLKAWKVFGTELQAKLKTRKLLIQERFRTEFAMSVDQPRSGGSGTSTTGNVCRKAFSNNELLSEVLDIDLSLITHFKTMLIAVNSQLPIDPTKFRSLCLNPAFIYNEKNGWFNMPPVVHKVLAYGADVILSSAVPVGMLGEDAAESKNKL